MAKLARFDLTLYLVIGSADTKGRDLVAVVEQAVLGGVTLVQLREKALPEVVYIETARRLKALLEPRRIPLIVNDSLEVALASGADGVHLGQDDMVPAAARRILGPERILGYSAGNEAERLRFDLGPVDYLGVGAVYPARSKPDAGAAIGIEGLAAMRRACALPLVAIGGIDESRAAEVAATGVEGIAVVSAIAGASDPREAARRLRRAFAEGSAKLGSAAALGGSR